MMLRKKIGAASAAAIAASVVLASCSNGGESPSGSGEPMKDLEIVGAFGGDQGAGFQAELDAWGATSGVKATYSTLEDFNTTIIARVQGGDAPDIAIFPQPGVLMGLKDAGMSPLNDLIDVNAIKSTLVPGWDTLAADGDTIYGLPVGANVKSLVWYNPQAFTDNGLTVPTTDDEMSALTEKIKADGIGYPWCIGIESGGATGWAATDWLEEYVLRYGGTDTYNKWWKHEIPFNDPIVKTAAEKFQSIWEPEGNVNGGGKAIALEGFGTAGNGLFKEGGKADGQCFMMRQGSFITDFFPDAIKAEYAAGDFTHVGVFPLPAPTGTTDGVLGGGDTAAAFDDSASTKAALEFILSDKLGTNGWANSGFFLSPHATFDTSLYPTDIQKAIGEQLANAQAFGFDASDLMPASVGSGTEWTLLTEWIAGQKTLDEALQGIETSWP